MTKHENLATALAAFQAELPKLAKDQSAKVTGETNDGRKISYSYGYAGLDTVTEEVSPALGKHGLSFTAFPTMLDNGIFVLFYALLHEAGEVREGTWPLPDPMRTKPQQLGSAITYARRYAFMAVTNTFPGGEDDDGAQSVPAQRSMGAEDIANLPRERPARQQRDDEPGTPATAPKKEWTDEEVSGYVGKLATVDLDKLGTAYDWMASKGLHGRVVQDVGGPVTATSLVVDRLAQTAGGENITVENVAWIRDFADARGLLKLPTVGGGSLGDLLTARKDALTKAALDDNPNAQAMRDAAAESWDHEGDAKHPQPTAEPGDDGSSSAAIGQGD